MATTLAELVVTPGSTRAVPLREELEKVAEILVLFGVYLLIGHEEATLRVNAHHLDTAVDRALPFRPAWIYPYLTVWIFGLAPLCYVRRAPYFRRLFASMAGALGVLYLVYLVFPTEMVLRAPLTEVSGFSTWLVHGVYSADPPYDCFPSLHVTVAHLSAWSLQAVDREVGRWAWVLALVVTASTVLVKQHYLADVAAGALVAFAAHQLTLGRFERLHPPAPDDRRSRKVLAVLAGLQATGMLAAFVWYATTS